MKALRTKLRAAIALGVSPCGSELVSDAPLPAIRVARCQRSRGGKTGGMKMGRMRTGRRMAMRAYRW